MARPEDMSHDELAALVSAHALHALDPEEAAMVERLIESSPEWRAAFEDALETAAGLALVPAAIDPPAGLRDRILDAARAEPQRAPETAPAAAAGRRAGHPPRQARALRAAPVRRVHGRRGRPLRRAGLDAAPGGRRPAHGGVPQRRGRSAARLARLARRLPQRGGRTRRRRRGAGRGPAAGHGHHRRRRASRPHVPDLGHPGRRRRAALARLRGRGLRRRSRCRPTPSTARARSP